MSRTRVPHRPRPDAGYPEIRLRIPLVLVIVVAPVELEFPVAYRNGGPFGKFASRNPLGDGE